MSGKVKKPTSVPNKEGFQRASFLYQLSKTSKLLLNNESLSRMYSKSMDLTLKKQVLKADPSIKRSICKKCDRILIIGQNCSIRLEDPCKKSETLQLECQCKTIKRYPIGLNKEYQLFTEKNSA